MAYNTYQDLVDSVEGYLHEDDLQSQIGDFVLLFESIEGAKLRHPYGQVKADFAVDEAEEDLPADCANVRAFGVQGKQPTTQVPYEALYESRRESVYAILGITDGEAEKQVLIQRTEAIESPYTAELVYIKKLGNLVDDLNWLYRNFPMLYLYGTLLQAQPYLDQDPRVSTWNAFYQGALEAMEASARSIESGALMRSSQRVRSRI